jgi:NADPH:quinone reductase
MVAGSYIDKEVACLADDGRLAVIAVQGGTAANFNAGLLLRKRLTITGSTLRPRTIAYKAQLAMALRQRVWPLLESGQIKPVIHSVFNARQPDGAAAAHRLMESNAHIGKIMLNWQAEVTE